MRNKVHTHPACLAPGMKKGAISAPFGILQETQSALRNRHRLISNPATT